MAADGHVCSSCGSKEDGPTPTQYSHDNRDEADSYIQQSIEATSPTHTHTTNPASGPHVIYLVVDTCYPTAHAFEANIGTTNIISVHSTKAAANSRAKKIIYENDGGCTVDIDKIIEEVKQGLYTGIGVGGKEEKEGCCFARKCEVEGKIVDEDSESEEGSGESDLLDGADGDRDGDVEMG
ncbi:hypothetical protein BDW02DRAFT_502305 [Decorospora gaudefroyi]|uniref:Uncharacterized protein n=1 Tax=Decorospora gaudefroyi TaxID=184978 RepID=A0A6A5K4Y6_9PLEO|nr:hypothetical protein BDW02DRAFT_502305 [Decorospora gaudefroyi]